MKQGQKGSYPLLLVHGYGARDQSFLKYWGRLPEFYQENGFDCYLSHHDGHGTATNNARQIAERIMEICPEAGDKVNIIAHSKGGLDSREMLALPGMADKVASLTTLGTPHHGIDIIDKLGRLPHPIKHGTLTINDWFAGLVGDDAPQSRLALADMSTEACAKRNRELSLPENVYFRAIGSEVESLGSCLDLTISFNIYKLSETISDGLVPLESTLWGPRHEIWRAAEGTGVTHHDLCDFHRRDIQIIRSTEADKTYSTLELFLKLATELKELGY
ncbi:MAG: alpha/beta fold hydrolase [Eubacteriales bacterium]|nr:alpha/beta fold hydrolase [Eubacteriales bacterium]